MQISQLITTNISYNTECKWVYIFLSNLIKKSNEHKITYL